MKVKSTKHLLASVLVFAVAATTAQAQTAPKMKMTTEVPPGIAIPDEVNTRLGTLRFFDGFPDDATVEKLYDNLDFQRAVQAYLLGLAPVSQLANRKGIATLGPINQTIPIFEDRMDSKSLFLTPNNNTPYTWFWLDLRKGPLVMEVPPKVLGLINDMWYQFVTDVGFTGPDKGEGGKYLLLPPGYAGQVPAGYHVVRCATYSVWVPWRSFLVNGDPKPGVDAVEKHTRIYPLKDAANPPKINFVHVSGKDFSTLAPADYTFWEYLNQVVQEEPTDAVDPVTLGFWHAVGIRKGKPFAPDARMKKILEEAALVGDATARTINSRLRIKESYYYPNSAWRSGFYGGYKFEENGARVLDAYSAFFFYATGVTPAMDSKVVGMGSQYMAAFVDSKGKPLDGAKTTTAPAAQHPGQRVLVGYPLRQPDPLDAPDRPALAGRHQPESETQGQRRRFGRHLLRSEGTHRQGGQLDSDRPRQGLEHPASPLRPAPAVVRQDLAAWRDRAGEMSLSDQLTTGSSGRR